MKKKFYLTTAISYTNAPPHIGHALELVEADTIARYRRLRGDAVFFATGTDEHGVKIARRAEELGISPSELVDENAKKFHALKSVLNLSWDSFIRTTDQKKHWPTVIAIWKKLYKNGDLYRKAYDGLYCVGHEAFVTKKDLDDDGLCVIHRTKPEHVREENWFFRLSKYASRIESLLKKNTIQIIPNGRVQELLALFKEGVHDVSFSRPRRDLKWGISVPGDDTQTMYVWADALVNYLSHCSGREASLWPPNLQIIGKDIIRFHGLIWIGMLLSLKKKLPAKFLVHGFVTMKGEKMSKSIGNVVDPVELSKKYGADAVRYFLLSEIPSDGDGDFTIEKLEARYQGDLANGLGNLVARIATLGERISPIAYSERMIVSDIRSAIKNIEKAYHVDMKNFQLHTAIHRAWEIIGLADRYINQEKPWAVVDQKALSKIIINVAHAVFAVQRLTAPFLPETAEKIAEQFLLKNGKLKITKKESLFPRLK
ncbi:MAG: methionine--tRNA ligase [Patescibacteria group bacterium]